jgi:hypothetical protein
MHEAIDLRDLVRPLIVWVEHSLQFFNKVDVFKNIWGVLRDVMACGKQTNDFFLARRNDLLNN